MLDTNVKLFNPETDALLLSPDFPALTGITNRFAGDFSNSDLSYEFRASRLLARRICGDFSYSKLIPSHGDNIFFFNEFRNNICADGVIILDNKRRPGVLMSVTADCPTIVFAAADLLAIVHSGRKGCQLNIAKKAVDLIEKNAGILPQNIFVGIFPGICGKCYAVKDDVGLLFPKHYQGGKLNLAQIIIDQLLENGIDKTKIFGADYCSCCTDGAGSHPFFSYRRDQTSARNVVFLTWPK